MLDHLVSAAFGRSGPIRAMVQQELERLRQRGYLGEDQDAQQLTDELLQRLEQRAERAEATVTPLLRTLGGSLRELLDIPSRAEVQALTEALRRAEAARAEADGQG